MYARLLIFILMLLPASPAMAHEGETHDNQPEAVKEELKSVSPSPPKIKRTWDTGGRNYFPNITLFTQDGEQVRLFDDLIEDKVVSVNFIYTSCEDSCPLETAQLKKVVDILGERVGRDIFFYSISIDPDIDTPEVLRAYKKKFGIGPRWTFLTGNETEIIQLRMKFGLYYPDLPSDDDHNLSMIIGNQSTGRWMKRSPFENPYVLATQVGDWLHNWQSKTKVSANSYGEAPELRNLAEGESLFRTRCSACHKFGVDGVGPDLMAVTKRRDRNWLTRWIKEPDKMLAEKDPLAMALMSQYKISMPNMRLNDQDIESVLVYIEAETERLN